VTASLSPRVGDASTLRGGVSPGVDDQNVLLNRFYDR